MAPRLLVLSVQQTTTSNYLIIKSPAKMATLFILLVANKNTQPANQHRWSHLMAVENRQRLGGTVKEREGKIVWLIFVSWYISVYVTNMVD